MPFRCDLATGQVGVAGGAVVEGLVGSDGVVDSAEPVDFDGEGVAVVDGSAVEVLVLEVPKNRSMTPLVCGLLTRVRTWRSSAGLRR